MKEKMTLNEIRNEIDQIDQEIKKLFLKRMECAQHVAETKAVSGGDVFAPVREDEIIAKRTAGTEGEMKENYTAFLKYLMCVSRRYQYGFLKKMQETVLSELFSKAGIAEETEHHRVCISFSAGKDSCGLNLYIAMTALNGIDIKEMKVTEDENVQKAEITLRGNLQDADMRRLLCQLGKEAPDFEIRSLEK